jgi:hypothetical protein
LGFLSDLFLFVYINVRHYSLALWGFRLRIDPDYPIVTRFFPYYIIDTVLEYRSYPLVLLWAVFLSVACRSWGEPAWLLLWGLIGFWISTSRRRSFYYSSAIEFWRQAWRESPDKPRVVTHFAENVLMEIEREMKAGKTMSDVQPLIDLGTRLVEDVTRLPAAVENTKRWQRDNLSEKIDR